MKGVRLTKAEAAFIRAAFAHETGKLATSVLAKLDAAETAPSGVAVKPIEEALIRASHGKVLPVERGHSRLSVGLTNVGATVADAELIGSYMARQAWLTSPMTLFDVINKWNSWLPKARATQPPPSLAPGLGGDGTGQGPAPAGKATPGRRTPQGFR